MCKQAKELKAGKIIGNRSEMQLMRVKEKFRKKGDSLGRRD